MANVYLRKLVESGVHFGHRVSRWNPKMGKYIYGKRNLIHIINLVETVRGLTRAVGFLKNLCATGQQVVFVGTKRQIKSVIQSESERCIMPYVNERWLGGTLTNFQTIRARLKRLEQLEELETSGKLGQYSKKIQSSLLRELRKIKKNLDGIREMHRLPGALVVVDPRNERISVQEANKLGIPVIGILDTDCDPDDVDIAIPGNDDAIRSVQLLLEKLVDAVNEGKANYDESAAMQARAEDQDDQFELASDRRRQQQQRGRSGGGGGRGGRRDSKPASDRGRAPAPAPAPGSKPAPASNKPSESKPAAPAVTQPPVVEPPPAEAAPAPAPPQPVAPSPKVAEKEAPPAAPTPPPAVEPVQEAPDEKKEPPVAEDPGEGESKQPG